MALKATSKLSHQIEEDTIEKSNSMPLYLDLATLDRY
jgi:hypothetical protein